MGAKKETGSDWLDWIKNKQQKAPEDETPQTNGQESQKGDPPDEPSQQTIPPPSPPSGQKGVDGQIDGLFEPSEPGGLPGGGQVAPVPGIKPVAPTPPETEAPSTSRLPEEVFACLALIDIGVKTRELPRFFHLNRRRTLAGRHVRAKINLDDEHSIKPEHARITYQEEDGKPFFSIFPLNEAAVRVNGTPISASGVVLKSGDLINMGSAVLVFFYKNIKEYDS